jgi:hypothetical protein
MTTIKAIRPPALVSLIVSYPHRREQRVTSTNKMCAHGNAN